MRRFSPSARALSLSALTLAMTLACARSANAQASIAEDPVDPAPPAYIGTAQCATCHEAQAAAWTGSHHALAWTLPSAETVLADFNNTRFDHDGITHRFTREGEDYFMETDGPDGGLVTYRVVGVAGIAPLQQFLFETEDGRIQAHDVSWDVENKRWYHLYPDQNLRAGDGLHWTGPYKNWNARCAECHATGFEKRYSAREKVYASRQFERGVGCEACHGPGAAHRAWAHGDAVPAHSGLNEVGLTANFTPVDAEAEIQQCAGCHSRREPLRAESPIPGTSYHDVYRLSLLRPGLYHADGSILDEVYVYGSFLQSKMYANGVRCTDCHDPHSAQRLADGNGVCTQCHSEAGNPRFPSLPLAAYDTPDHHFHAPGSPGAQCVSCHMIERTYMQIDGRRDHGFRVPRPDLSDETGAPNACTDCHTDNDAAWAAREIAKRFADGVHGTPHVAQAIAAARRFPAANREQMIEVATDPRVAAIVRATALELLRDAADGAVAERTAPLLRDPHPLIRAQAVSLQRSAPPDVQLQRLLPLLEDPVASVRIATVRALIAVPPAAIPEADLASYRNATAEFQDTLIAKLDFPETHLVLGGSALVMRNLPAAQAAFREAVTQDPQLENAWSMLVRIRLANGDVAGARAVLVEAREANPSSLQLLQLGLELNN